ncbi:MAG: RecQ family ATP-dependent DNA helicase [Anaerolineae bacterium]
MTADILRDLGLTPQRVKSLSSRQRRRLLTFLLQWEHLDALDACLDALMTGAPDRVTLLDLKARALAARGDSDTAIAVMGQRLGLKSTLSAQALLVGFHLAKGDVDTADEITKALVEEQPESVTAWQAKAETALTRGDLSGAAVAYQRLRDLQRSERRYLMGMVALHQAQDDWVTASGYAVRLLNTAERPEELPITYLRKLLSYFEASEEETRARELGEVLDTRYAQDLAEIKELLGSTTDGLSVARQREARGSAAPEVTDKLPPAIEITVSEEERLAIEQAVRDTFGFESLLPGQLETIAGVMRDENVLTILPTGGGKSLCYQMPALLADEGTTLVISPLIALMKDQVDSLPEKLRERATTINSSLEGDVLRRRLERTARGDYRLLYAAPERLRQPAFLHTLRRAGVNRLVIDEAHCVSVWGHDFRPDYLKLFEAWQTLGEAPILALTATAPPRVRRDIIQHLSPDRPMAIVVGNVFRPNLQLEVFHAANVDEKIRRLVTFCQSSSGSGIVYADTRDRCEQLAGILRSQGVDAAHYHAGISNRDEVQDAFMSGETRVIVATIAFGMGIDKADIRSIVHFRPPASLESYYQEAGRAGRDGLPARCLLMYAQSDRSVLTRRVRRDLPTIEFLRQVYAAAYRHLGQSSVAKVACADLERELQVDDTRVRVALSILEENDLLRRGPDIPRTALVRVRTPRSSETPVPEGFRAFCDAARCRPEQWQQTHLLDVAQQIGLDAEVIEDTVLAWQDAGLLRARFSGRDMLLARKKAPSDVARRIGLWVDSFAAIQEQRIDEIASYATADHCRHGYLSAYLGGEKIDQCGACDNCVLLSTAKKEVFPEDHEQLGTILDCAGKAPWSWGRYSLVSILQGNNDAPAKAGGYPGFGALSFRSKSAINKLIEILLEHNLLAPRQLDHGGTVLDLTRAGRAAVKRPATLKKITEPPPPSPQVPKSPAHDPGKQIDQALFDRLRSWRRREAKKRGVPPYVIFHDNHLRDIAMAKPQSEKALLAVKGVGSRKLEEYGDAVLKIVRRAMSQVANPTDSDD